MYNKTLKNLKVKKLGNFEFPNYDHQRAYSFNTF